MYEGWEETTVTEKIHLRLIMLSFALVFCAVPGLAQSQEVQVLVNGPWTFAQDPDDSSRVVLIALPADHHGPVLIFPGEDASNYVPQAHSAHRAAGYTRPSYPAGRYALEFSKADCPANTPPSDGGALPISVKPDLIKQIVNNRGSYHPNTSRYSVSLPAPCYYTHLNQSYSRIASTPGAIASMQGPGTLYTVLMVLHYFVKPTVRANLTGEAYDETMEYNDTIPFAAKTAGHAPAISIVMPSPQSGSSTDCDSHSLESFVAMNDLLRTDLYGQFPELDKNNGHQLSTYNQDPKCIGHYLLDGAGDPEAARDVLVRIAQLRSYQANPGAWKWLPIERVLDEITANLKAIYGRDKQFEDTKPLMELLGEVKLARKVLLDKNMTSAHDTMQRTPLFVRTESEVSATAVGTGDCHAPQVSINRAVP